MQFPPRPLDEIQTNLVCESLTKIGRATAKWFWVLPPREGSKDQKSLNYNNKVNSKVFCTKLLVFLQIKDIKHIEWDFCSDAPGLWHGEAGGAQGVKNDSVACQIDRDVE